MISRRTLVLANVCALSIAIPTAYSKGRSFEGRMLRNEGYVAEDDALNNSLIVFARTLVGGEPESLRVVAGLGLLLTGTCLISIFFDFAPVRPEARSSSIASIDDEAASEYLVEGGAIMDDKQREHASAERVE